jgi:hypothetical protein
MAGSQRSAAQHKHQNLRGTHLKPLARTRNAAVCFECGLFDGETVRKVKSIATNDFLVWKRSSQQICLFSTQDQVRSVARHVSK